MERICEGCERGFDSKREDARFCSDSCRKKLSRTLSRTEPIISDKSDKDVTDNVDPLKRITRPPEKIYDGYYKSDQYKNLIEELELKPLKQLREEGYYIPAWKENGMSKKPSMDFFK